MSSGSDRLADLHRQGFMKSAFATKKPKKVRVKGPTVECFACMNWHEKNKHTKALTAAEKRRAVQVPIAGVAGVKAAIDLAHSPRRVTRLVLPRGIPLDAEGNPYPEEEQRADRRRAERAGLPTDAVTLAAIRRAST
jgi:hypothetical protein